MIYLNATEYARKHGKSKQRVIQLINNGKIPCWRPLGKAIGIDAKLPWPKPGKPGAPTVEHRNKKILVIEK